MTPSLLFLAHKLPTECIQPLVQHLQVFLVPDQVSFSHLILYPKVYYVSHAYFSTGTFCFDQFGLLIVICIPVQALCPRHKPHLQ